MPKQNVLSIVDLGRDELEHLVSAGLHFKSRGCAPTNSLMGKSVGLYFERPSTRTRTSFFWATNKLGGRCIVYDAQDLQLRNGESRGDTGMALGLFIDALVVRTDEESATIREIGSGSANLRLINGLSADEHPTQAIADLITMRECFGSLRGRHLLYIGAANNTMNSLVMAASTVPELTVTILSPPQLSASASVRSVAARNAAAYGAEVRFIDSVGMIPRPVDVVYATRWESMGREPPLSGWREIQPLFRVTPELFSNITTDDAIFMHDLPATRGAEVTDDVMDGASSRVQMQAFNKGVSAAVCLEYLLAAAA